MHTMTEVLDARDADLGTHCSHATENQRALTPSLSHRDHERGRDALPRVLAEQRLGPAGFMGRRPLLTAWTGVIHFAMGMLLLLAVPARGQTYNWNNVVIKGGGFVTGLITHPNAPGVVYARTDIGGAYRWNAASNSWIPLLDFAADAQMYGIESVAIDPSDTNRLYIAASRGSSSLKWILISTNQGATFSSSTPPFSLDGNALGRGCGERMAVDPNLNSVLFYGTRNSRLYKSVNFGTNWSQITFPVTTTANGVGLVFVEFIGSSGSPGAATPTLFVGVSRTGTNIYRSTNGGSTWTGIPLGLTTNFIPHHAAQDGLGNLYVTFNDTCGPNSNVTTGRVCKVNLSTLAFSDVTPVKQAGEQGGWGGVSVDRQHPTNLVVCTLDRWWPSPYDQVYRSTNGGTSWKTTASSIPPTGSAPWTVARTPHWAEDVEIDPFDSNRAWFVTGYGVFSCTNLTASDSNGTVNWAFTSDGLEEMVPLGLASPPSGPYLLSGVGDQGGFRHFNLDVSPPAADYFSTHRVTSFGIDFAENNPNIIARLFSNAPHGAYSPNGGTTWYDFGTPPAGVSGDNRGNIAVSADGSRLIWMPQNSAAYYSTNNGSTWTASTGGPTATRVPVADRVNGSKFYIYNGTQMYVSTNGGVTYSLGGTTTSSGGGPPCAVFGREGHVLLPLPNGLWLTTNSGASLSQLHQVQQASYVGVGKAASGQSYPAIYIIGQVGGVTGIYRSDDEGANWTRINDDQHQFGLSWIHVFCADPRVYGRVYFGTEGRGIIYGEPATANTPPMLAAISNQTVNVGQTVAFIADATDTDAPPQTLTFALLSGPANATLNTNTGAFSWRPEVADANTINPFTLKVSDDGIPSLSTTQSFSVTVNPLTLPTLSAVSVVDGQLAFQVGGDVGPDYAVLGSTNLIEWTVQFMTNPTSMPFQWVDTNAAALPAQFYRVKVGPPLP